ncbi:MAG: FAD-dependent oxidoreductase [Armatimonadetes bacterium]|nr:FAD-dependent oxidoreductase [Armatimonadota bacterium]
MNRKHFLQTLAAAPLLLPSAAPAAPKKRVIVVGGGLTGLIAARELEKRGIDTVLIEAADRLGGRVATAHYGHGLQAEYGMQEIWEKSPLLGIVKELGLKTESGDDPYSSLLINDRLYPFVQDTREQYFSTLFTPPEREQFRAVITEMEGLYTEATRQGLTDRTRPLQEISYADWLEKKKLPTNVLHALRLTIEVELAAASEQFSALSAILEWRTFLFKGEVNYHVEGGNWLLIQKLGASLRGPILLNARVTEVNRDPGKRAYVTYIQGNKVRTMTGDAVVMTIPWIYLHQIQFRPALTALQLEAIESLGRGQYTVVHMLLDRKAEKLWDINGEAPFPVLSAGPLGVIYGPHATNTSGPNILFSLLVYGLEAQAYHMAPRDAKRKELMDGLDKLWPGFSKHVRDAQFYTYHPAAVAYWPPGRSPLDEKSKAVRTPNAGLFLAGDWTESSHSEGAAVSALETAHAVAAFLKRP